MNHRSKKIIVTVIHKKFEKVQHLNQHEAGIFFYPSLITIKKRWRYLDAEVEVPGGARCLERWLSAQCPLPPGQPRMLAFWLGFDVEFMRFDHRKMVVSWGFQWEKPWNMAIYSND